MIDLATLQMPIISFAIVTLVAMLRVALIAKFPDQETKIQDFTVVAAVLLGIAFSVGYAYLLSPTPDVRSAIGSGIFEGLAASGGWKMFKDLLTQVKGPAA